MNSEKSAERFVVFLRGINVGGHHKVSMAELRKTLESMKCNNIETLLNSGNIILETITDDVASLEDRIAEKLEKTFGFPIPTIIRKSERITQLYNDAPFKHITLTRDIRLYVSFLKRKSSTTLELPWFSPDNSFKILVKTDNTILSVLNLAISRTPTAMKALEEYYGLELTTRNWNTIERIAKKL